MYLSSIYKIYINITNYRYYWNLILNENTISNLLWFLLRQKILTIYILLNKLYEIYI